MARAGNDIHVRIAETIGGVTDAADERLVERGWIELADDLAGVVDTDLGAEGRGPALELLDHREQCRQNVAAEIDREDHLLGDDVAAVGIDLDMAHGADRVGLVLHGDLVNELDQTRHAAPCVAAHRHRRRSGVLALARDRHLDPAQTLAVGHDADLLALRFEDRALFDVVFEHGMHRAATDRFCSAPADAVKLVTKAQPLGVVAVVGIILVDHPRIDT